MMRPAARSLCRTTALLAACTVVVGASVHAAALTLSEKAAIFEHDLRTRFTLNGQVLCKLKVPTQDRPTVAYNMPDNAYMTGIHLGTLAMKYAATRKRAALDEALDAVRALDLLCTVSGKPGLLARAAWPADRPHYDDGTWRPSPDGRYVWRGDVSSDQIDGVMYGFSLAYDLLDDEDAKATIAKNVAAIVDHILRNNARIIGYDGEPTTWGSYFPEYVARREPMNALLLSQHLKVAEHVTGEQRFADAYREFAIDKGYAAISERARLGRDPMERGAVNHSDDVLIFLAYYPLLRLEHDAGLRASYLTSLERAWRGTDGHPGVRSENNPFYAFIAREFLEKYSISSESISNLVYFPFDMKWNRSTIEQYQRQFEFTVTTTYPAPPASGDVQAIPVWQRRKSWSAWVMDPYHSRGTRDHDSGMEYNGHDFLMAYWLGRYLGYIDADD